MRVSVVATVKNEEESILRLIDSLLSQSRPPDEIVIVDGGSTDGTRAKIQACIDRGAPVALLVEPGANISRGRNVAIAQASGDIIAVTDAGVRLERRWLERLVEPFERAQVGADTDPSVTCESSSTPGPDVVSGFFVPDPSTLFETALGATILPALRDIDPARFLPSSRSVAFKKSAWAAVGGYPEWLDYCEDLVFDLDLKARGFRFVFAPEAVVHFQPRPNLSAFFKQYYRYARGDGKARLWTKRHVVRYAAYGFGCLAVVGGFWYKILWLAVVLAAVPYLYGPYRRLASLMRGRPLWDWVGAAALVPIIRFVGDVAKMLGYPVGLAWRFKHRRDLVRSVDHHRQLQR